MKTPLDDAVKQSRREARLARAEELAKRLLQDFQDWASQEKKPMPKQQIDLVAERQRVNEVNWNVGFLCWGMTVAWLLSDNKRIRNAAAFMWLIGSMLGAYERSLDRDLTEQP